MSGQLCPSPASWWTAGTTRRCARQNGWKVRGGGVRCRGGAGPLGAQGLPRPRPRRAPARRATAAPAPATHPPAAPACGRPPDRRRPIRPPPGRPDTVARVPGAPGTAGPGQPQLTDSPPPNPLPVWGKLPGGGWRAEIQTRPHPDCTSEMHARCRRSLPRIVVPCPAQLLLCLVRRGRGGGWGAHHNPLKRGGGPGSRRPRWWWSAQLNQKLGEATGPAPHSPPPRRERWLRSVLPSPPPPPRGGALRKEKRGGARIWGHPHTPRRARTGEGQPSSATARRARRGVCFRLRPPVSRRPATP